MQNNSSKGDKAKKAEDAMHKERRTMAFEMYRKLIPTKQEQVKASKKRREHPTGYTTVKRRNKLSRLKRKTISDGSRVSSLARELEELNATPQEHTYAALLAKPVGAAVCWPSDVPRFEEMTDYNGVLLPKCDEIKCKCVGTCHGSNVKNEITEMFVLAQTACGDRVYDRMPVDTSGMCINAQGEYACTPMTCSLSAEDCGRRPSLRGLELFRTVSPGIGVRTTRTIKAGQCIGVYTGKVITKHPGDQLQYTVELKSATIPTRSARKSKVWISADEGGGMMRFVSHSCAPNTRLHEWIGPKGPILVVVALREIRPSTEITFDYREPWFVCECGEENCKDRGKTGRSPPNGSRKNKEQATKRITKIIHDESKE